MAVRTLAARLHGLLAVTAIGMAAAGPAAADATAHYRCADGTALTATFTTTPGAASLTFADGRSLTLPQALSADGGRYAAGDDEFWIKGEGATLTRAGKSTSCTTTP